MTSILTRLAALLALVAAAALTSATCGCGTVPAPGWTPSRQSWEVCCQGPGPCDFPVDPNCDESCAPGRTFNRDTWTCEGPATSR